MLWQYKKLTFAIVLIGSLGIQAMATAWIPMTAGYVEVEDGTSGETVIRFNLKTESTYIDTYFPYRYPDVPQSKVAGFSLWSYKDQLEASDCLSIEIYPELDDRAAVWFDAGTVNGKWAGSAWPLKPRQWNQIYLGLSNLTPTERRDLAWLKISNTALGLLPGDSQWQTYRIRNLVFGQLPSSRTESGWQPTNISISRIGFPTDSSKQAVVPFGLVNTAYIVKRQSDGVPAFLGYVGSVTSLMGSFGVADFSTLKTPGRYQLVLSGETTVSFEIGDKPYSAAATAGMNFFESMRSGTATAAHPTCFLDDSVREDTQQWVNVSGGWFDAAGVRGYYSMAMTSIMRMFCLAADASNDQSYLRAEAAWAARQYQKLWCSDNGLPYTGLALYPSATVMAQLGSNFYKSNNYWTNNQPGTDDDRTLHTAWSSLLCHLDLFGFNAGMTAAGALYTVLSQDSFTDACKTNSERHFLRLMDPVTLATFNSIPDINKNDLTGNLALLLESAVALGRHTGSATHFQTASDLATKIMQRQTLDFWHSITGHFGGCFKNASTGDTFFSQTLAQEMPIAALLQVAAHHPTLPDNTYLEILLRAGIYADFFLKQRRAMTAPYYLPFNLLSFTSTNGLTIANRPGDPGALKAVWTNIFPAGFLGAQSFEIQRLAGALQDSTLMTMAEELLRWQFGANPFSVNMMAAVGDDEKGDIMSSVLGYIPGMMSNCTFKDGSIPELPHFRHYSQNEIYTQTQGPFQAALHMQTAPVIVTGTMINPPSLALHAIHSDGTTEALFSAAPNGSFAATLPKPGDWKIYKYESGLIQIGKITAVRGTNQVNKLDGAGGIEFKNLQIPSSMQPNTSIAPVLTVYNYSTSSRSVTLQFYGINLTPSSWSGTLLPGNNIITLSATVANTPNKIGGIIIALQGKREQTIHAAGAIE